MRADLSDLMLSTLCDYIASGIPKLTVRREFPYANEKLSYPSVTVTTIKPKRMPAMDEPAVSTSDPDANGMVTSLEVAAYWEDTFQMDLWCSDKRSRKEMTSALIDLFNSQSIPDTIGRCSPDGLSLPMADHFGEIARYEIDTVESVDDEAGAQRGERREKIRVIVNCRELRRRTYYAIIRLQTQTVVGDDPNPEIRTV